MTVRIGPFVELGTARGEPFQVGERRLVPVGWIFSVSVGRPGAPVAIGVNWTHPIAVEVQEPTGFRRVAIPDLTTRVTMALLATVGLRLLWHLLARPRHLTAS